MKNKILVLIIAIFFVGCMPTVCKYPLAANSGIIEQLNQKNFRFTPISPEILRNNKILETTYYFLSASKRGKVSGFLSGIEDAKKDASFYMATAWYCIYNNQYNLAMLNLKKVDNEELKQLKDLLVLDLKYEIQKQMGLYNYKTFLLEYQKLIDKYPEDELLRRTAATRIRFIRYNY